MSLPLVFHAAVQTEVREAHDWYEAQQAGLGSDFVDQLERVLTSITSNPTFFGIAELDIRAAQLKRFPYIVYYRVLSDRIRILAVFHAARDPSTWQSRD